MSETTPNQSQVITIIYNTALSVYNLRVNLIKEIQQLGYRVIVISPYDKYVEKLKALNIEHHDLDISQYGLNPIKEIVTTYKIYQLFKKYRPKYSLHYTIKPNIYGGIAAYFSKTQVINNIAGAGKAFTKENSMFARLISLLFRIGLRQSKNVLFQNHDDMNFFIRNNIVPKEKTHRIPGSGVDLTKYKSTNSPINSQFIFVGRLLREKGIEYYLEAAEKTISDYPNAIFKIVGPHEDRKEYIDPVLLEKYLENPNIIYLGTASPDDMPLILEQCECVVLPSHYREGVPRSLLEAASMSKPVITTESVGCREVVQQNVNGFKCPIKDSVRLHESMKKFLNLSTEEKKLMGQNGRAKMEREFDENIVLDTYKYLLAG